MKPRAFRMSCSVQRVAPSVNSSRIRGHSSRSAVFGLFASARSASADRASAPPKTTGNRRTRSATASASEAAPGSDRGSPSRPRRRGEAVVPGCGHFSCCGFARRSGAPSGGKRCCRSSTPARHFHPLRRPGHQIVTVAAKRGPPPAAPARRPLSGPAKQVIRLIVRQHVAIGRWLLQRAPQIPRDIDGQHGLGRRRPPRPSSTVTLRSSVF